MRNLSIYNSRNLYGRLDKNISVRHDVIYNSRNLYGRLDTIISEDIIYYLQQ